ncbi:hypothetical protein D3C71_1784240 [compost metagenome]
MLVNYPFPGILIYDKGRNNNETIKLYQRMNNDLKLKELFLKFNKAYDECIIQIKEKNDEITADDFEDL